MGYVNRPGGVDAAYLSQARFEIEIAGDRFAACGSFKAPYDPESLRVKS
jgi:4-methylaminobutanoate oxidase (formaldehyde-forming)